MVRPRGELTELFEDKFTSETKPETGAGGQEKDWNDFAWSFVTERNGLLNWWEWEMDLGGISAYFVHQLDPYCPIWQPPATRGY